MAAAAANAPPTSYGTPCPAQGATGAQLVLFSWTSSDNSVVLEPRPSPIAAAPLAPMLLDQRMSDYTHVHTYTYTHAHAHTPNGVESNHRHCALSTEMRR